MGNQYRINGGYKKLIDYLETQCKNNGCSLVQDAAQKRLAGKKMK
jgi:hypothetical protein